MIRKEIRACRKAAVNELCRVCQDSAHGFHFGVMVCRACAAFFRRTIALNMSYHCRFDKECQIDKSIRCMCRACRHTKCITVGMKPESVQLNRDTIGKQQQKSLSSSTKNNSNRKKEFSPDEEEGEFIHHPSLPTNSHTPNPHEHSPTPPSNSPPTTTTTTDDSVTSNISGSGNGGSGMTTTMLNNNNSSFINNATTTITSTAFNYDEAEWEVSNRLNIIFEDAYLNPRTSTDLSIIEQFQVGYRHLCTKRPMVHQTRFIEVNHETLSAMSDAEIDRIFLSNWEALIKQHEIEIDLIAELMSFIRPFVGLPKDQRWLVFRTFWLHFLKFERAFDTYRVLGDNPEDKRVIMYNGQTLNFFSIIFGDNGENNNREVIGRFRQHYSLFRPAHQLMRKGVVHTLKHIKPTDVEFCAMCLHLMFLHPGIETISEETIELGNYWRQQAFQELHEYYVRELGLTNYASRLGEFMALMSMVEKNTIQKRENYRIAEVFSICKVSPLLMTFYRDH